MKNYSVPVYDKSCNYCYWIFHKKECYEFPVFYKDGLVSRLKSSSVGREPWGVLLGSYIVSIKCAPHDMTPAEAKEYCDNRIVAGRCVCIPSRAVMKRLLRNWKVVNEIIRELGGNELEVKWYMAANDTFTSCSSGATCDDIMLGISLAHLDDCANNGTKICWEVPSDMKIAFYPAVRI